MTIKVVALNGSPKKEGNTHFLMKIVTDILEKEGIEVNYVHLGKSQIRGCIACMQCFQRKDNKCAITNDPLNDYIKMIQESQGVLLGTPTYFANVSTEVKSFIDRAGMVAKVNGDIFRRKVGAGVVAVRRGGSCQAFNAMNHLFTISQMIIPGSCYWNMGIGLKEGQVLEDSEGVTTMEILGENMAWLLKKLYE